MIQIISLLIGIVIQRRILRFIRYIGILYPEFQIDSTKLISSPTDTFFVQINPHNVTRFVYKVTCVDKQGNESEPSEEKVVNITWDMTTIHS